MANDSVTATYRISSDIKQKVQEIMKSEKLSADALFTALISAYEETAFKSTSYGQAMSNDLDAWAFHSASLQQLYTNAIRSGIDAKTLAKKEVEERVKSAEEANESLRAKLRDTLADKQSYIDELTETRKQLDEANRKLVKAEKSAEKAESNADAWKESINTLTSQLNENREKLLEFDKLREELAEVKAKVASLTAENEALGKVIDKYLTK